MDTQNKVYYMLFELGLYDLIIKHYNTHKTEDPNVSIIVTISKIITTSNKDSIKENLRKLFNTKPTEVFTNPKAWTKELAQRKGIINPLYTDLKDTPIYKSPGYNMVSINGLNYDSEMDLMRKVQQYSGDSTLFKEHIDLLRDKDYANYLKLIYALNNFDLDYGLEAGRYFIGRRLESISPLVLIVQLLEAKQRTSEDIVMEYRIFKDLEDILADTLYALNLVKIKQWKLSKLDYIAELGKVKNRLLASHPQELIEEHYKTL